MKTMYCYKCGAIVANINNGTIRKGSSGICNKCLENEKIKDAANKFSGIGETGEMPGLFKDIFKQ